MRRSAASLPEIPVTFPAPPVLARHCVAGLAATILVIIGSSCSDDHTVTPPPVVPAIADLAVVSNSTAGAFLTWTPPEVAGLTYDLRYSLEPINEQNWELALPIPIDEGAHATTPRRVLVPELYRQVNYSFSIRTRDQAGTLSAVSNCPNAVGRLPLPGPEHWFRGFEGGLGLDGEVRAMAEYRGDLIVAGYFANAGGVPAAHIARFDGSQWHALGSGLDGLVLDLAVRGEDLFVVGLFERAGVDSVSHVARWDGTAWHAVGAGLETAPLRVAAHQGLVVAGFGEHSRLFAAWDGTAWQSMAFAGVASDPDGLCLDLLSTNDGLLAGGEFFFDQDLGTVLLRWDGTAWSRFSPDQPPFIVSKLHRPNGQLVVSLWAGLEDYPRDTPVNLRWSGLGWVPYSLTKARPTDPTYRVGGGSIVAVLDGKPIAIGDAATGAARAVLRLEGDTWMPLGSLDQWNPDYVPTGTVVQGHLYIGGAFHGVDGIDSPNLIRWDE